VPEIASAFASIRDLAQTLSEAAQRLLAHTRPAKPAVWGEAIEVPDRDL
jgi:predicted transcriptional regulator